MSQNWWVAIKTVPFWNEMQLCTKIEQTANTCNNMDIFEKHYAKWNKRLHILLLYFCKVVENAK